MTRSSRRALLAGAIAALACTALPAAAQSYPTRPITLIVPWGAAGRTGHAWVSWRRVLGKSCDCGNLRRGAGKPC